MPGRVFISCGQANDAEYRVADEIKKWFQDNGFIPYVAITAQSIQDITSSIIGQLRKSDYYVFIDFPRELCVAQGDKQLARGSLFTHQELALAYCFEFKEVLFFRHKDVCLEGLLKYIASNATVFNDYSEVPGKVIQAVNERRWTPQYCRHLVIDNIRWSEVLKYRNPYLGIDFLGKFLYGDIHNRRNDLGSASTFAKLATLTHPNGEEVPSPDCSPLKTTGQQGFVHQLWPQGQCTFDLLHVSFKAEDAGAIYLNSALDDHPRRPIITASGDYRLHYEFYAEGFDVMTLEIALQVGGSPTETRVISPCVG